MHYVWHPSRRLLKTCEQPYMASDRGISFAQVLLQADIGQRVLPEDGLGIQVGGHESTLSRQSLQEQVNDKKPRLLLILIDYVPWRV